MKIYPANRKGLVNYLVLGVLILPVLIFFLDKETFTEKPFILLPLFLPIVLSLWMYFGTVYEIENKILKYRSGYLRGKINIHEINEIIIGETRWFNVAALAKNGLVIKYHHTDEIYIAPVDNNLLIADLLKINTSIHIVE